MIRKTRAVLNLRNVLEVCNVHQVDKIQRGDKIQQKDKTHQENTIHQINQGNKIHQGNSVQRGDKIQQVDKIPSPKSLPYVGTTLSLISAGSAPKLHKYIDWRHKQLGPIFKDKIGPTSAVFISNPQDIRTLFANEGKCPTHVLPDSWVLYNKLYGCSRGLFFMDGDEWLENRKVMNKLLLKGDLKWMDDSVQVVADDFVETLGNYDFEKDNLELMLYTWSFKTILSILIGSDLYKQSKILLSDDIEGFSSALSLIFEYSTKLQLIPSGLAYGLNLPQWKRFKSSVDSALSYSRSLVSKLIKEYPENDGLLNKMLRENLNADVITKIVADLIIAAGDTTANSMQWVLYLISKYGDVQETLRDQLQRDNSPALLRNILKECLRLYPVAPFISRYVPEDVILGGYAVPKGALVIASLFTSGRDVNYFEDPEEFKPNRWLRGSPNHLPAMSQASLPFAMGARSCIGKKIAETQIIFSLRDAVKGYKISLMNENEIEMTMKMVAVPSEQLKLKFIRR